MTEKTVGEGLDILLVEDNPGDARLLEEYLSEAELIDTEPDRVGTLEAALDRLGDGTSPPDVVLLDLGLPDAAGLEAVESVVEEAPELPVLVLTSRDDRRTAVEALREGAEDYLLKGEIGPEALARSIRYAVERSRAEAEIRRQDQRFRALISNISDVISVIAPDGTVHYESPSVERILGYKPEEMVGEDILEYVHPDDRDRIRRKLGELGGAPGGEAIGEARFRHADGSWRVLGARGRMPPEETAVGGIIIVSRDVTERVERERELERATASLRERVKEQSCLYDVSQLLDLEERPFGERLQEVVDRLPEGWQYPEVTAARLRLEDEEWISRGFAEKDRSLSAPITVDGDRTGEVEVCYLEECPEEDIGPFLREERTLLAAIADQIGLTVERSEARRELEAERARLTEVFEVAPAFIATLHGPNHVFEMVNPTYRELAGDRDYIGRPVRDVFPELEDQQFFDLLDEVYHTGEVYRATEAPVDFELGGSPERRYLNFVYQPRREEGEVVGIIAHGVDVTEEVRARRVAERAEERYRTLFSESPVGIAVVSEEGRPVNVNGTLAEMLGREPEELKKLHFTEYTHPEDREGDVELYRQLVEGEIEDYRMEKRFLTPDAEVVWADLRVAAVDLPEQGFSGQVAFVRDITEQKRMEEELRYRALHDALTGLPNRSLFGDRLELALARSHRHGHLVGLLMLDVDRFKQVNDQYGHAVGDRLLQEVAERLQSTLRGEDTAGRLGGDEFGILLADLEGPEDLTSVRTRLMRALERPYRLGGEQMEMDLTVGAVVHGDDAIDGTVTVAETDDLLRYADLALHRAKDTRGSSFHLFSTGEDSKGGRAFAREQELRRAVREEEFELRWQPIVRLEDGSVQAIEPLARWRHPEHGVLSPVSFISLAEETGLIQELGELLFRQVCREAADWAEGNGPSVRLTPNLSGGHFDETDLPSTLREIVEEEGLEPDRFWLEITETEILRASEAVERLRELGFAVFVDDFGTGHSSFHYLRDFRFEGLKIDMSFVHQLGQDDQSEALVETMITMGRAMEMRVVAEGIETEQQRDKLVELGCDLGQGFLFARPMAADELTSQFGMEL